MEKPVIFPLFRRPREKSIITGIPEKIVKLSAPLFSGKPQGKRHGKTARKEEKFSDSPVQGNEKNLKTGNWGKLGLWSFRQNRPNCGRQEAISCFLGKNKKITSYCLPIKGRESLPAP